MSVIPGMSVGDVVEVGPLLGGVCSEQVVLQLVEEQVGVKVFDATYFGVRLGGVTYADGVWLEVV